MSSVFNDTFTAFLNEAKFAKEMLGSGATQIRNANYATKGLYFQSFTSLSTGLERIGKLCLIVDYYVDTGGGLPDRKLIKTQLGHDLELLSERAKDIVLQRNLDIQAPTSDIHNNILGILSNFAKGDRYTNIDSLVGTASSQNPIEIWYRNVDLPLFEERVTEKKKLRIRDNAKFVDQLIGTYSRVLHTSESGEDILDVEDASFRTGLFLAVAPYRQLYVLQIIRFWASLLSELQHLGQALAKDDIPYFGELFGGFRNDDSYLRTRKTWDRI